MAYVYRYGLEDSIMRKKLNLVDFKEEIIEILKKEIGDNLKSYDVRKEYFEIRIHFPTRIDRKYGNVFRSIREEIIKRNNEFKEENLYFTKQSINYYMFINKEEYKEFEKGESSTYNAEIILCDDIMEIYNCIKQYESEEQYEIKKQKYIANLDILKIFGCNESMVGLDKLNKDSNNIRRYYGNYYIVEISGIMKTRTSYNTNYVYSYLDASKQYGGLKFIEEVVGKVIDEYDEDTMRKVENDELKEIIADKFKIYDYNAVDNDLLNKISSSIELNFSFLRDSDINQHYKKYIVYDFIVWNVGQGLATTICGKIGEKKHNIFFDFGSNKVKTIPKLKEEIEYAKMVFLSHVDRDHWRLIDEYEEINNCKWVVPYKQKGIIGLELRKRLAIINTIGGRVEYIKDNIRFSDNNDINVYVSLDKNQIHKHKTGIAMSLIYKNDEKEIKILNSGDQEYHYISDGLNNTKEFKDIDVLVASHHGGQYDEKDYRKGYDCSTYNTCNMSCENKNKSYCWAYGSYMDRIPKPKDSKSIVIYSAGNHRRYNHPSRKMDYRYIGWIKEHITKRKCNDTFKLSNVINQF